MARSVVVSSESSDAELRQLLQTHWSNGTLAATSTAVFRNDSYITAPYVPSSLRLSRINSNSRFFYTILRSLFLFYRFALWQLYIQHLVLFSLHSINTVWPTMMYRKNILNSCNGASVKCLHRWPAYQAFYIPVHDFRHWKLSTIPVIPSNPVLRQRGKSNSCLISGF